MHRYEARVSWKRRGEKFTDNRYSRGHEWSFDGGVVVPASASPSVVPLPRSVAGAVDPEEAVVAAASSCHMLFFLSIAARLGFVVESYVDDAFGVMEKNDAGKVAFSRITLRPKIEFAGEKRPSPGDIAAIHHESHEECYIASSLRAEIVVESA